MKISESKIWPLLIVFILSIQIIVAQDKKFGIIGGLNYTSLYGDFRRNGSFPPKYMISFHAGLTSEFQLSDRVNFSPRLVFSSQGYRQKANSSEIRNFDPEFSSFSFKSNNKLNYLNVPLTFGFSLDSKMRLNFGPQFGFLINRATTSKVTNEDGSVEEDKFSNSGDFELDYGAVLGISYNISDDIFMELGYFRGFSNISRGGLGDVKNNNTVFQVSLGYNIF